MWNKKGKIDKDQRSDPGAEFLWKICLDQRLGESPTTITTEAATTDLPTSFIAIDFRSKPNRNQNELHLGQLSMRKNSTGRRKFSLNPGIHGEPHRSHTPQRKRIEKRGSQELKRNVYHCKERSQRKTSRKRSDSWRSEQLRHKKKKSRRKTRENKIAGARRRSATVE